MIGNIKLYEKDCHQFHDKGIVCTLTGIIITTSQSKQQEVEFTKLNQVQNIQYNYTNKFKGFLHQILFPA